MFEGGNFNKFVLVLFLCSSEKIQRFLLSNKMTKLDRLNTFMTERLMEAVKEIILTVGSTVREYEEETERIRTENERLKEMLRASGCFPEHTNAALQSFQPRPIPSQKEELEYLEKIQQNQWQAHLEQQIKPEEPACSADAYQESTALPSIVDNKDPCDTNPADDDEITDFPKKIKVEINSLCSGDDIRNTEDAYQSWSPHSPELPLGMADFHRSQHPSQPTHTTNETPPTLSQHSSLSDGAHHLPYHNILCTNSYNCNSKCCEMQKRTIAKSSPVWKYFSLKQGDCSKAVCLMCKAVISRGRKEYTTSALLKHLRMKHGNALASHFQEKLCGNVLECLASLQDAGTSEPASLPQHLKWRSSFETEPTEIYQDQVLNDQLTSTKVEEFSSQPPLVTEPHLSSSPIRSTLTAATDENFQTSTFPCDIKTEPLENFDSQFTNANTSTHSPLPHCTAQVSAATDDHMSDFNIFSISNSTVDLESPNCVNNCRINTLKPRTLQMSINPSVLKTPCPETDIISSTDLGSPKIRIHDVGTNGHLNVAVNPPRHITPFGRESRLGRGKGRGKCQGKHVCSQCGKLFPHHSRLKVHMRIHTGEKPYACAQCGKRFNNDGTLRNHRRVHLQLRLYDCPVCSRSFKDAYTRRNHMRLHERSTLLLSHQAN